MNVVFITAALLACADPASQPFAIEVVDEQTGRGVPLVELTTTGGVTYVTDSAGLVAYADPGLTKQRVFFRVQSHGYEFPQDGFGIRGVALEVTPGGSARIKIKRLNIAERLYRVTGEGIYRDSVLLGRETPIKQPLLNAKVTGCDSVQNAIYRGRLYWFWGDTNWPAYPLGLFHTSGAVSQLPGKGGLEAWRGVDLQYFMGDHGFARATAKMAGEGPTWIDGLTVLRDANGRERLLAAFAKVRPPLTIYRRGICEWNDDRQEFEKVAEYDSEEALIPFGHPAVRRATDDPAAAEYVYFGDPFPLVRVRATVEDFLQRDHYEAYTCLKSGTTLDNVELDRDDDGRTIYSWKRGVRSALAFEPALIGAGKMKADDPPVRLRDRASGKAVKAHRGTVNWNAYRRKWIAIFVEQGGTSQLGEVWFAEADSPQGPWADCVKIVTHDKYSFYNPKQHPYFDQEGGRILYFEGTYTHTFSGNEHRTPRYDYNQIMYRLDLGDERLKSAQQAAH